jgi:DNA invertase Pin-like site-specific DNA recombinase
LAACGAGEARALVVARLDRVARSLSEAAQLLARAQREGWNLVAVDLGLDLSTSEGKRVANKFASVAAWERQLLSARSREALAHAARRESSSAPRAGRLRPRSPRSTGSRRRA